MANRRHDSIVGDRRYSREPQPGFVDEAMRGFEHIGFTDSALHIGKGEIRAGLVTSLGFGHVSGLALLIHPGVFPRGASRATARGLYRPGSGANAVGNHNIDGRLDGSCSIFEKRNERRFDSADGTPEQAQEESLLLTDPEVRLGKDGTYSARVAK